MVFWCNQSHGKMVFYPFPESPSICCRDLGPACLSQQAWKLAQKERLACANYILISGNVLANQASIAILEHIALLCRLQTVAPACGSKNVPGTSRDAGCTALHHSFLWWHAWPPRWKHTDAPWLAHTYDPIPPRAQENTDEHRDPLHNTWRSGQHVPPHMTQDIKETRQHENRWK